MKTPTVSVDIVIIQEGKVLLGLFTEKWFYNGKPTYGLPGREIRFGEKFSQAIERDIREELGCSLKSHSIIAVNANHAFGNHFIGIGAKAAINGKPKVTKPEDWQSWEWFDMDKLPDNLFPPAQNLIESYRTGNITVAD